MRKVFLVMGFIFLLVGSLAIFDNLKEASPCDNNYSYDIVSLIQYCHRQ